MFLENIFDGAFGLSISDAAVKLIQLKKKSRPGRGIWYEVGEIRQTNLPAGSLAKGEMLQPDLVREKITHLLGREGQRKPVKSSWVVANLPVAKTFLKLIEIAEPPDQIIAETVEFEAAKHLPFDTKEVALDWQIVNDGEQANAASSRILIGAAPKSVIDSYLKVLEDAGLHPLALEIEDLSIARAMITAQKSYRGEARAILDLGASRSSVIIYDKGSIQFSSLVGVCGDVIDTALTQRLKIDRKTAEELKTKNGLAYDLQNPNYLKVLSESVDKLIDELRDVFNFYKDHFPSPNPITHITMSGGLSVMKNLDKILSKKMRVNAYPGNAWKNLFNPKLGETDRLRGLPLTSAIGLALRAADWDTQKAI